ncbi:MAG: hypothetical protein HYS73_00115 [Parcubacteria group bacterium]|nr:hypothetical protein [Parcubacteria group bacterium]
MKVKEAPSRRTLEVFAAGFLITLLAVILVLLSYSEKEVILTSFYCRDPVTPLLITEATIYGETKLALFLAAMSIESGDCALTPNGEKSAFPPLGRVMTFGTATNGGWVWRVLVTQRAGKSPFGYTPIFEKNKTAL